MQLFMAMVSNLNETGAEMLLVVPKYHTAGKQEWGLHMAGK